MTIYYSLWHPKVKSIFYKYHRSWISRCVVTLLQYIICSVRQIRLWTCDINIVVTDWRRRWFASWRHSDWRHVQNNGKRLSLLQNDNMNETDNIVREGYFRRYVCTLTVMLAMMNAVSLIYPSILTLFKQTIWQVSYYNQRSWDNQ